MGCLFTVGIIVAVVMFFIHPLLALLLGILLALIWIGKTIAER